MPYDATSDLRSPAVGTAEAWTRVLRDHDADEPEPIAALYLQLAPQAGLNGDLALAQAAHETGWFQSPAWRTRRNPAGLGITGPGVPGPDFQTIERGVKAHLAHLCCYVYSAADCPIERGLGWEDPRHGFHDATPALGELKGAKHQWAADPDYIAKIVRLVNTALDEMGDLGIRTDDPDAILERAYQAGKDQLGDKRFAGLLRRPEFGDGAADSYPMLVCERGILIVVNDQARDVTARCLGDFIAVNERDGKLQRF